MRPMEFKFYKELSEDERPYRVRCAGGKTLKTSLGLKIGCGRCWRDHCKGVLGSEGSIF